MAESHEKEKAHYEQQIEYLQHKQSDMEIRIAHLLDEQQGNERSLQQEIESLKLSKAELEEKVAEMRQQHPEQRQEAENELLEVIERQESVIQQLKERAHQRSVMLREENETLKKEVEHMQTRQEKIHWGNQMLESSLKSLQHDLAEYLLLKNNLRKLNGKKNTSKMPFIEKFGSSNNTIWLKRVRMNLYKPVITSTYAFQRNELSERSSLRKLQYFRRPLTQKKRNVFH